MLKLGRTLPWGNAEGNGKDTMKKQHTINFSPRALDRIKRPRQAGDRINYYDSGEPGLVLRVSINVKTFCYVGRINGKPKRVFLGYSPV